jgi:ABC-type transport system involved in multi-copper enzyme maturation permease subunit
MRAINIIARDTLMELSKRKVLLAILITVGLTAIFFILAIVVEPFVAQRIVEKMTINNSSLGPDQTAMLVKQFNRQGYNLLVTIFSIVIELLGTLLAIIMFSTLLPGEIERGSIKFLISKPVSRLELMLGKWAGGGFVLLCYSAGASLLQMLGSLYLTGSLSPDDIRAFPFLLCKLLIRGSVSMCFSIAMKPILAGVLAFFVSGDIFALFAKFTGDSITHYFLAAISYLLPNYSIYPVRSFQNVFFLAMGASVPELSILGIAVRGFYALLYIAAMLYLTSLQFERKDLT